MQFPDFLEPCKARGRDLLAKKKVREVLFSGPTYQIEIEDLDRSLWVFVQLDEQNSVKDIFCSCDESTERGQCAHMAAACLFVFSEYPVPLHLHFEHSFWKRLFFAMQEKCGNSKPKIKETLTGFELASPDGLLFTAVVKNKTKEIFSSFLQPKPEETEETSIKFSNLSVEEIERWRQGRPSLQLRYELSCLSDIAKWLFLEEIRGIKCQIYFEKVGVVIERKDLRLECPLSKIEFEALEKPSEAQITSLHFDPVSGTFEIHPGKKTLKDPREIAHLLHHHLDLVQQFSVHKEVTVPKYKLFFDRKKELHIEAFLFELHDLESSGVHIWQTWAFLPTLGFFCIEPLLFEKAHHVIKPADINTFILQHRGWLCQFSGFSVHMTKLQEEIVYEVDTAGNLLFHSVLEHTFTAKEQLDFGNWIYVINDGFYVKHFSEETPPLLLDHPIVRSLVADFIRHHLELLQNVPGFFASDCPIKQIGLSITLKKKGLIEILPEYEWFSEKDQRNSFFYDDYVYVHKKGFYRLPSNLRPMHFMRYVSIEDVQLWNSFFLEQLPSLKAEYHCHIDSRLEKAEALTLTVVPMDDGDESSKQALSDYSLDIFWQTEKGKVLALELLSAKSRHERFVPTEAGLVDLSEDRFQWLDRLKERKQRSQKSTKAPAWRLFPADFLHVQAYDTIHIETLGVRTRAAFKQMLERLLAQVPLQPPHIGLLNCELRPYQLHGVHWLWFLYLNSLSGLLCDDMGVGKTHQAMGLMDAIGHFNKNENKKSLFLVVCPTSLIYHWQDKINRFLPFLRVKSYVGFNRTLEEFPEKFDLLLTTYGIWRNEANKMRRFFFDAAFFDELQIAKNHVSQIHGALLQVQAQMKVGLTGTPIENQLRELKALFDIVLPGYMPSDSDFREFFVKPIEKMEKPERKVLLSRFVKPFVLRRRKAEVLPELPEKTEELCYTELLGEQKNLYRNVASLQAMPLIQQLKDESLPIPYMHIFALLSSLKQICNHPAAYLKDVENFERYESGKWDAFVELLEEAQESEQKVVVFSQYLAMLDIIEAFLRKNDIGYAHIRGQTKNRADEVERFHKDPHCMVFLGSLHAAGLGIDLTPASVVIHYDRWWNAARENQATDRVHRFGQVRGVQVFKMLTKATIEEKIDLMIGKKAGLLEDIVSVDDHQIVKKLTRQEIISLLEGFPEE